MFYFSFHGPWKSFNAVINVKRIIFTSQNLKHRWSVLSQITQVCENSKTQRLYERLSFDRNSVVAKLYPVKAVDEMSQTY